MFSAVQGTGQSVDQFVDTMVKTNATLGLLGRSIPESILVTQVLNNLRPRLRAAASHLSSQSHTMTLSSLRATLRGIERMQEETEVGQVALAAAESALAAGSGRGNHPGASHKQRQGYRSGAQLNPHHNNTCGYCGHPGHIKADCPLYRSTHPPVASHPGTFAPGYPRTGGSERHGRALVASVASHGTDPHRCFITAAVGQDAARWVIDSGASAHMTPRRDLFITYTVLPTPQRILFGGGASAPAIARGSIRIAGPSGTVTLEDVLHVPELACNLLSLPTATRRGVQVAFSAGGEQVVFF